MRVSIEEPSIDVDYLPQGSAQHHPDGHLQFSSVGQLWEVVDRQWRRVREPTKEQIVTLMVERFLAWQLPDSVCSDLCVTQQNYPHPRHGTSLLTATEARQMLVYLLG